MSSWYVSYRTGASTVMSIAKSRDEAISTACGNRTTSRDA
jgi:hypothetical protein